MVVLCLPIVHSLLLSSFLLSVHQSVLLSVRSFVCVDLSSDIQTSNRELWTNYFQASFVHDSVRDNSQPQMTGSGPTMNYAHAQHILWSSLSVGNSLHSNERNVVICNTNGFYSTEDNALQCTACMILNGPIRTLHSFLVELPAINNTCSFALVRVCTRRRRCILHFTLFPSSLLSNATTVQREQRF